MTLYLLNHFSNVGLVLLIVGGTTALAIVVTITVHRLFRHVADSRFEELTGILRADVFALLYTIVLVLVISDLSGNLEKASSKVSSEASTLSVLTRGATAFPSGTTKSISDSVNEYVHAVVEDEWPELRWGEQSSRASAALEGLYATVRGFEPHTPGRTSLLHIGGGQPPGDHFQPPGAHTTEPGGAFAVIAVPADHRRYRVHRLGLPSQCAKTGHSDSDRGSEGRGGNRVAPTENTRWRAEETRRPMALRDRTALERRLGPHEARCPV